MDGGENMSRRSRLTRFIITAVLIVFIILAFIWKTGPGYGVFILPPSPGDYGSYVLSRLEQGLGSGTTEWISQKEIFRQKLKNAQTYDEADEVLKEAILTAGGKDSKLITRDEKERAIYNFAKPEVVRNGDILTITLPEFMGNSAQAENYVRTVSDALTGRNYRGVILDISNLKGGSPGVLFSSVAPLLEDGKLMTLVYRGGHRQDITISKGQISGFSDALKTESIKNSTRIPLAVITGENTEGSGEQLLTAFNGRENLRIFGKPTAGMITVKNSIPLLSGNELSLTVGLTEDRRGVVFGYSPIYPDEEEEHETALKKAAEWLTIQIEQLPDAGKYLEIKGIMTQPEP